jgi:nucleotide-binding universal stress UspA family protein
MFSNLLLAFDGTREGHAALNQAIDLAKRLGASVHLLSVVHLTPGELMAEGALAGNLLDLEETETHLVLIDGIAALKRAGLSADGSLCVGLNPAMEIVERARQIAADLIVIGHRQQGALARLWNGSVGQQLLAHAPCSVLVAVTSATAVGSAPAAA